MNDGLQVDFKKSSTLTISANYYSEPRMQAMFGKGTFGVTGSSVWNCLTKSLRTIHCTADLIVVQNPSLFGSVLAGHVSQNLIGCCTAKLV